MRRAILSFMASATLSVSAQQLQSGTPAELEVVNGKSANVFLQGTEENTVQFQAPGSSRSMSAPAAQIKMLTFLPKYDAIGLERSFADGDYEEVVSLYDRALAPYWSYMSISNNLQDDLLRLTRSYLKTGKQAKVAEAVAMLQSSRHASFQLQGRAFEFQLALQAHDVAAAEEILNTEESKSAKLYFQACIDREKNEPRMAIKNLTQLIAEYGNEYAWMSEGELLCAELYLEMGYTNSAAETARQVGKIYKGDAVAGEAIQLAKRLPKALTALEKEKAAAGSNNEVTE